MTYLISLEVQPMGVGEVYEQLPMHCTIMPRFHSKLSPDVLSGVLAPLIEAMEPLELQPLEHVAFGPKQQLVTTLVYTPQLRHLHEVLYDALTKLAVQFTEVDWVGPGFIPHVSDKKGRRFTTQTLLTSSTAYLINFDHPLEGRSRKVVKRYKLGSV